MLKILVILIVLVYGIASWLNCNWLLKYLKEESRNPEIPKDSMPERR